MNRLMSVLLLCLVLVGAGAAGADAATFHFTGHIDYHNDVDFVAFSVANPATNVAIWTDSFIPSFDPITALWDSSWNLLAQNDDTPGVGPGQDYWDSGMIIPSMAAGNYYFSVASFDNFANGPTLGDGFYHDGETPIPIQQWWTGGDGDWSLWLDGVDTANPVPEPGTVALLGIGLGSIGLASLRRRRRKGQSS